ncbi:penicillin-binding protein 1F [Variibacter gotjawalensis]|uniref:Penicillin-binding protein 1F n=1 Tax=Variibacter gotjawalensis TaxID=1333996 RepID=A0A0S3PZ92_9BRAD|nr:PBP1A family penicillin-binding protein [Variibacter gotjawalensis]NIK47092.1 penicillin-binding protein 1A [Variibacter gotjawalensis]RZS48994.1 penicillin-binding protein 1A [Variibacter gotjawalensis]BAT61254.1 penicillin-binding protein 1F [Variibacter gotjawalensis]
MNTPSWKEKIGRFFLDLDARVDSLVFQSGRGLGESYERFSIFMDRFHVAGFKRFLTEGFSEAATLGTVGLLVLLTLAGPAFRETSDEDWLKKSELAVTFLDRYGNEVGSRGIRHNDSVPLEEFPDHLIKAVLATEDRRFYEHFGIDIAGTARAFTANARAGGVVQGGSSITQQLAKNLFLSNERTIERKVKEAFLALWLETRLTKNQILKLYLDRAYMGGGTFGVDAAAQYYFGKSAREVSLAEAAMLAGLFKAPTRFAPHVNLPAARARASVVLDNLVEAGFMTEGQVFGARRGPATAVDRRDERSPNYYLDWAFDEMKKLVDTFPKSIIERVFVVRTGLDVNLQREAENAVENSLRQYGREYGARQAATVLMDIDGTVRAMVGGRDYGSSQFNRATDALRQPGSSFKPYVYAAAFEAGMKPTQIVRDEPICLGNWCPQNYGRSFAGAVTLTQALVRSINTIPVRLSVMIGDTGSDIGRAKSGRAKIIKLAQRMGLRTPLPDSSSLPIGAAEVTVLDHTAAYTAFPNGGKAAAAHAVLEVRNGLGEVVWSFAKNGKRPEQVIKQQVASDINAILNKAVEEGTGKRSILDSGIKSAGKTGTTNGYRDAWFVGYTGNYVCAVWFGNDDYSPTNRMTGGSLPAMTWKQIVGYAHQGVEAKQLLGVTGSNPPVVAQAPAETDQPQSVRPAVLSRRAIDVLQRVERRIDEAMKTTANDAASMLPSEKPALAASTGSRQ